MKNKWADEGYHNKNSSDNSKDNVYQPRSLCKNTKNGKIAFKPKTLLIIENDRILSRLTMERQNLKEALLHDQFVRKTYWNFDYFLKKFQAIRSRHKQSNLNVVISDERWYLYIIAKYCFGFFGLFWKKQLAVPSSERQIIQVVSRPQRGNLWKTEDSTLQSPLSMILLGSFSVV